MPLSSRVFKNDSRLAHKHKWEKQAPRCVPNTKAELNNMYNRMTKRGVPWKLARQIAEEFGSESHLHKIYSECEEACQKGVLSPIISNTCSIPLKPDEFESLQEQRLVLSWSAAIHSALHSSLPEPSTVRLVQEYKFFTEDRADHVDRAGAPSEIENMHVQIVNEASWTVGAVAATVE
jgi:hypothetical protein